MNWFTLLIASGLLLSIIAVMTILEATCYKYQYCNDNDNSSNSNDTADNSINSSSSISIRKTGISFDNRVIIRTDNSVHEEKNEATDHARAVLLQSLLSDKHDSMRQYIPVIFYSSDQDITDKFEYHSIIESKTLAIAIRIMLVNNNPEHLDITRMVVKSNEGMDLFILDTDIQVQPYQRLYIIWYIQLASENVTEAGISQMLAALAYSNSTQYRQPTLKDVVLLDNSGNPLPFYLLHSEIEHEQYAITLTAYMKNNTAKEQRVKTIAVRNTTLDYIFAYDLEEELTVKPYSKVSVKVSIQS